MSAAYEELSSRASKALAESRELVRTARELTKRLADLREETDLQLAEWRDLDAQVEEYLRRVRDQRNRRP